MSAESAAEEPATTEVVVVATPAAATGFRLGGARTVAAADADETVAAVDRVVEDGRASVIAIHGALWAVVPTPVRSAWTRRASPLIISLPAEDGAVAEARDADLRELLARAVGYRITFTPGGGAS